MNSLFALISALFLINQSAFAGFYDDEVKPVFKSGFDSTGLILLATGATAAGVLKGSDQTHLEDIQEDVNLNDDLNRFGDFLGTGAAGAAIVGLQYWLEEDPKNYQSHLRTLLWTGGSTILLKGAFDRKRPSGGKYSMPSGHTSTVFATATSLTYSYGWKAAVAAYPLALMTVAQRIDDNKHWLSDTVAGAFLGIFWARAVHNRDGINVTPVVSQDGWMLFWRKQI